MGTVKEINPTLSNRTQNPLENGEEVPKTPKNFYDSIDSPFYR